MVIQVDSLTKRYGTTLAVDDLSFEVKSGAVTGFLGPNGAGKSTTMRMILGLDQPSYGTATVDGHLYRNLRSPMLVVGALLDAAAMHPGRTGLAHLRVAARSNGIPLARVEGVIEQVGLGSAARRRIKGYSLGMRQRLGIATALLGDPAILIFDEPVNGLDLDGVRWIRGLLRSFADEGRTVLVSSHLMSEMQMIADRIVVIGRGRLILDATLDEMLEQLGGSRVVVLTNAPDQLSACLPSDATVTDAGPNRLEVAGVSAQTLGELAFSHSIPVYSLAETSQSLEDAYLSLTTGSVEYRGDLPSNQEPS